MSFVFAQVSQVLHESSERPWLMALLAGLWHEVHQRYGGFFFSDAFWLITALWAADYLLGSLCALVASYKKSPTGRWCPSKAAQGVFKWLLWIVVCWACFVLRQSGRFGFGPFASLIESAVALTLFTSSIRNAGKLSGAAWLERFAVAGESGRDRLAEQANSFNGKAASHLPTPGGSP